MNSLAIVARIEADCPLPSAHLDSPYLTRLEKILVDVIDALWPVIPYLVSSRILSEKSIPYFNETRQEEAGMPLQRFYLEGIETAWNESKTPLSAIASMLRETDGPFFMGETVSYADFVFAGVLLFFQRSGDDQFSKLLEASGDEGKAFNALLLAVTPWSARDS